MSTAPRGLAGRIAAIFIDSKLTPLMIAAALVMLAASAAISFGFVMQRGGIDLPSGVAASPAAAVVATPATSSAATTTPPGPTASETLEPSIPATPVATSPAAATPPAASSPKPSASTGGPSASRLAVLKPCPGQAGCYVYTVRSGDNLFSIAHWFGVPLNTVYAWNPTVKSSGIQPGVPLKIPTPTR